MEGSPDLLAAYYAAKQINPEWGEVHSEAEEAELMEVDT